MKTTVKEQLEKSLDQLKEQTKDKIHESNIDIIVEFLDKVIAVEFKRLKNSPVPDEVLLESLNKMKRTFDKIFKDLIESKIFDLPAENNTVQKRNSNGHKKNKKRDMKKEEKDTIEKEFLVLNGQITEDACKPIHDVLRPNVRGNDISIFQVTGYVTFLHKRCAEGKLKVQDMNAYETFLQEHRNLWAKYNSPKYRLMRGL